MKTNHDILFKVGLGLQLLLIPVAFLWRFSPEAKPWLLWAAVSLTFISITTVIGPLLLAT